jgi:prepilin-type N-terminal cleavage/methylation domain-containing protein
MRRSRCAFTLIEVLVVIAIISILMGLLLPALGRIRRTTERKAVWSSLQSLKTALTSYHADLRLYPRAAPRRGTPDDLLQDDGPAFYAALMNRRTVAAGGGPSAPYSTWDRIGTIDRARLSAATMGYDGVTGVVPLATRVEAERADVQASCGPRSATPLVFLDVWGGPIHYREWESVANDQKHPLLDSGPMRTGFPPVSPLGGDDPVQGSVQDRVHDLDGFEIWSNGPNGVNELGQGDDVCSWLQP